MGSAITCLINVRLARFNLVSSFKLLGFLLDGKAVVKYHC